MEPQPDIVIWLIIVVASVLLVGSVAVLIDGELKAWRERLRRRAACATSVLNFLSKCEEGLAQDRQGPLPPP